MEYEEGTEIARIFTIKRVLCPPFNLPFTVRETVFGLLWIILVCMEYKVWRHRHTPIYRLPIIQVPPSAHIELQEIAALFLC